MRRMWTLVLLVSVVPLGCRASWMWLGVTSSGPPARPGCDQLPLSPRQRELCGRKSFLLPSVLDGARLAVSECQNQFRLERWNCSTYKDPPVFGQQLTSGTKETAFIYAIMAAGLVHAVTRSCSQVNMTECGCDARLQNAAAAARGFSVPVQSWHWGGCSDHIQYGTWFSRRFMETTVKNMSASRGGYTLSTMNQHNAEAGRQGFSPTEPLDSRLDYQVHSIDPPQS
ncbi:protein Wnt-16 [Austrofundulus limnaeus]|uniref:Protein Wnt n=1 Tax=Austrofundulus limnaeus TaxID=52670 RepID=A0A2I4D614_AUSLI|nr:PREDICTED: protein Wnt-16-like [Austrofundulus limnaeus]